MQGAGVGGAPWRRAAGVRQGSARPTLTPSSPTYLPRLVVAQVDAERRMVVDLQQIGPPLSVQQDVDAQHLEALALAHLCHREHRLQASKRPADQPANVLPQAIDAADLACSLQRLEDGGCGALGAIVTAVCRVTVLVVLRLLIQACEGETEEETEEEAAAAECAAPRSEARCLQASGASREAGQ